MSSFSQSSFLGVRWQDSDSDGYDSDRDGELSPDEKFTNYEEFMMDTHPTQADTDGDNCSDFMFSNIPLTIFWQLFSFVGEKLVEFKIHCSFSF